MSVVYRYWGNYRSIANGGAGLGSYGFPTGNGNINRLNNPNTTPIIDSGALATYTASGRALWAPDNTNYSGTNVLTGAVIPVGPNESLGIFTIGGISTLNSSFGVAFSTLPAVTTPATQLLNRWILIPNTHGTVDGTAPVDPTAVTPNVTMTVPVNPVAPQTIASDVNGTAIINPDQYGTNLQDYQNSNVANVYAYFFLLPGAFKFSTDWYTDITIPPYWCETPPAIISPDGRTHGTIQAVIPAPAVNSANLVAVATVDNSSIGMEDLPSTTVPGAEPFTMNDYNDFIFGYFAGVGL